MKNLSITQQYMICALDTKGKISGFSEKLSCIADSPESKRVKEMIEYAEMLSASSAAPAVVPVII